MHSAEQIYSDDFSISRAASLWFRDSCRYRGVASTVRLLAVRIFEFLREFLPSRRRLRYGDLEFDFEHGVDTTWSNINWRTRLRELFSGEPYQPIEATQFHEMVGKLAIDYSEFTFIDFGSGKGRAMLLASVYPFRNIVGVEILPELNRIAEENFGRYRDMKQKCKQLESWCGDARDFDLPPEPTVLYLFNPFFEPVLKDVLQRIERSVRQYPRKFIIIYANPLSEHVIAGSPMLRKLGGTHQYSIFELSFESS